jgi:hypothetical protein
MLGWNQFTRNGTRIIVALASAAVFVGANGSIEPRKIRADSQNDSQGQRCFPELLVIQGRIMQVNGALVTVKTPDMYPSRSGVHPQFVLAGIVFTIDMSHARVLLHDGRRPDAVPLATGDHVLMVLSGPDLALPPPNRLNREKPYSACIVERIVASDKVIGH